MKRTQDGALVGVERLRQFDWKVGRCVHPALDQSRADVRGGCNARDSASCGMRKSSVCPLVAAAIDPIPVVHSWGPERLRDRQSRRASRRCKPTEDGESQCPTDPKREQAR
jgi:hypothetical protein